MPPNKDKGHKTARPRISSTDAKFAIIIVGPDAEKFTVHEELLIYHSPYFRAALTGHFKEAKEKTITLEDEDPEIFEYFVHWLYHDRCPEKGDCVDLLEKWHDVDKNGDPHRDSNLIYLYVFGDKYQVHHLKTACLDQLFDSMDDIASKLPALDSVKHAFDNLIDDDPLNRLLADFHAYCAVPSVWRADEISDYPPKFLTKVLYKYAEEHSSHTKMSEPVICDYHKHESREEKLACRTERNVQKRIKEIRAS